MTEAITEIKKEKKRNPRHMARVFWLSAEYISVHLAEALSENFQIIRHEANLFMGTGLTLIGFFNWSSAKYCDGNTADYLSCTRPVTYYYYGGLEIAVMVLGVTLILIWYVRNRKTI